MFNILVAPNSFKECKDAVTLSELIADSLQQKILSDLLPEIKITKKPISDGGDGFLNVCKQYFKLETISYEITTPWGNDLYNCIIGHSEINKTAFIESANVLGLIRVPKHKRNPLLLNSRGMGQIIKKLQLEVEKGEKILNKLVIGIGGTGTNDLGLGALEPFNLKLFNKDGRQLEILPQNYKSVSDIDWNKPELPFQIELILDVHNPLLGEWGASRTFSQQKGASKEEVEILESGFENIISLIKNKVKLPDFLSGAGGGLAAGLNIFFGATYTTANDFIQKMLRINANHIKPDLLITGEGSFDTQTFLDKGTWVIIEEFSKLQIPIFIICGELKDRPSKDVNISFIELSNFFKSRDESINKIDLGIQKAAEIIAEFIKVKVFHKE